MRSSNRVLGGFPLTSVCFSLALLLYGFWLPFLAAAQSASSKQASQTQGQPWLKLKSLADNLPGQISSYDLSLKRQIATLQDSVKLLEASNELSKKNLLRLSRREAILQGLLQQSRTQVQESNQKLATLSASLTRSSQSITKADRLARRERVWLSVLGVAASVLLGYSGGHVLGWW